MKKFIFALVMVAMISMGAFSGGTPDAADRSVAASRATATTAIDTIPVPLLSYFQERRTIEKWAKRWDKPSVPTYVYLFAFGNCIGYYVTDGKPASTRSYLTPEYRIGGSSYGYYEEPLPDIDGTYGDNNQGIRFFTAAGAAVEWGGSGASYLYSDAILPLNVPKLNK